MEIKEEHKEICGSIATCQENNRSFTLKNATDFIKVKIDGAVFPNGDKTIRYLSSLARVTYWLAGIQRL